MQKIRAATQSAYVPPRRSKAQEPAADARLRRKIMLLAGIPMLVACIAMALSMVLLGESLAREEKLAVAQALRGIKQSELRHYTELAQTAIAPVYASGRDDAQAKAEVLQILSRLTFGDDGYFFVYDFSGHNLMHPRQPELIGKNLWELRDSHGGAPIQQLIASARAGGGFVTYEWARPTTHRAEDKLGYVIALDRWGWMVGTGIYLDDVAQTLDRIDADSRRQIRTNLAIVAVVGVIAAFLVGIGGLALNLTEHRRAETELRELARQVVSSQEQERARLSRELHDGVTQMLVSVKFAFESALARLTQEPGRHEPIHAQLQRGIQRLQEVLGEIRRISHALRPESLDNLGLAPALERLGQEFSERCGVSIEQEFTREPGAPEFNALPEAQATTVFRVAQEALLNIERHAQSDHVRLSLQLSADRLNLRIRDNGIGFDPQSLPWGRGIGLRNMRERVAALQGELHVSSGENGTEIHASLPIGDTHVHG